MKSISRKSRRPPSSARRSREEWGGGRGEGPPGERARRGICPSSDVGAPILRSRFALSGIPLGWTMALNDAYFDACRAVLSRHLSLSAIPSRASLGREGKDRWRRRATSVRAQRARRKILSPPRLSFPSIERGTFPCSPGRRGGGRGRGTMVNILVFAHARATTPRSAADSLPRRNLARVYAFTAVYTEIRRSSVIDTDEGKSA